MNDMLLQGEYADIILELLEKPYNVDSIPKIVFLSFCIRNETQTSYRARKTDFADALLSNLSIHLLSHPDELKNIFEVINKLRKCGWIKTEEGKICILREFKKNKCENRFLDRCREGKINPIIEVNRLDDKAFIEEVLRHV